MKKFIYLLSLAAVFLTASCSYDEVPVNGYVETTQEDAQTLVLKGYESANSGFSVCKPKGFDSPFYLKDKNFTGSAYDFIQSTEKRLDQMQAAPVEGAWAETVSVTANATYWVRYADAKLYHFMKMRVASIDNNNVTIEYIVTDQTAERPNENINANEVDKDQTVARLEIPRLNPNYVFVSHSVEAEKKTVVNYSLEWVPAMQHSNWVAFSFDKTTCQDNVKRTDDWNVDPKLPVDMQVQPSQHKNDGFDRGHLCASEDRVYTLDANKQTFYFSNMSPQIADLNQGVWQKMEALVQSWGRSCTTNKYDVVYVTKGGTMNELLKNYDGEGKKGADGHLPTTDKDGKTVHGLACPKYYFMAVLAEKDGGYQAIGLLVEHKLGHPKSPSVEQMQSYVVSIDELEKKTGIDFFCNLNDLEENIVESAYDLSKWTWN